MTKKILEFTAPWCSGCRILEERIKPITEKYNLVIEKINVEKNPQKASQFYVTGLPTIILMTNERIEKVIAGLISKEQLEKEIIEFLRMEE